MRLPPAGDCRMMGCVSRSKLRATAYFSPATASTAFANAQGACTKSSPDAPIPHCGNCPLRDSIPNPFDHLKSRHRPSRKGVHKLNQPRVHDEADDGCDFHLQVTAG
ncbi:hypothetical protein CEXT_801821 [Caerostris extrusa]|uniref:Uncharacterized protein n=1 Tax=Caerostris extrusa TaxID=172846 RepID=A0AAV4X397_CAEEX|nr:hypothetical protein CEXT_801821 [Caerostris extrusa]